MNNGVNTIKVLKVLDVSIHNGFFFVELADGKTLQCCLEDDYFIDEAGIYHHLGFLNNVNENCKHDLGDNLKVNKWAIDKYGSEIVLDFLIEQANLYFNTC